MARKRLRQKDLAPVWELSNPQISQRLNGVVTISLSEIVAVSELTGVPVEQLIPKLPELDSNQQPAD